MELSELIRRKRMDEAVLLLERTLLEGGVIDDSMWELLPAAWLDRSALLLQARGDRLLRSGRLAEAKAAFSGAVKGFALQTFRSRLLASMACLADVQMRSGEWHAAETLWRFLRDEYEGGAEERLPGEVLHTLALGAYVWGEAPSVKLWLEAAEAFEREDRKAGGCRALLELLFYSEWFREPELSEREYVVAKIRSWTREDPRLRAYEQLLAAFTGEEPLPRAEAGTSRGDWSSAGLHLAAQVELCAMRRSAKPPSAWVDRLHDWQQSLAEDVLLQLLIRIELHAAERPGELETPDPVLERWKRRLRPRTGRAAFASATTAAQMPVWRVHCFGSLRFAGGGQEVQSFQWKRRKAQELFAYLLLQPGYGSTKEQLLEVLWPNEDIEKSSNVLYVVVHQLKRTLRDALQAERAVTIKDGSVRLREGFIEFVDVEKYLALLRVADQLWTKDRSLSLEMYREALAIYDDLLPGFPYADWLERLREYVLEQQISASRKLGQAAEEAGDWELAQSYYADWVRRRPYQEEAYHRLIGMLAAAGRHREARRWYDRWAEICQSEFGLAPSLEIRCLLKG